MAHEERPVRHPAPEELATPPCRVVFRQGGIPLSLTATVIGIVPNLRQRDFQLPDPDPIAYLPFRTDPRYALLLRDIGLDPGSRRLE